MAIACPFCEAPRVELISLFGSQLLLSQYRCTACGSYFEGVRQDRFEKQAAKSARDQGESIDGC
jgi:transposase-like protein